MQFPHRQTQQLKVMRAIDRTYLFQGGLFPLLIEAMLMDSSHDCFEFFAVPFGVKLHPSLNHFQCRATPCPTQDFVDVEHLLRHLLVIY